MTRYQEFLNVGEGISTNILAERLARLEKHGIIAKTADPNDKRQFLYSPTQKALDLLPVIFELARWGIKHDPDTDLKIPFVQEMTADEYALMKGILSRFN